MWRGAFSPVTAGLKGLSHRQTGLRHKAFVAILLAATLVAPRVAWTQTVSQRGSVEGRALLFPQDAPNDRTSSVVDVLVREEAFVKLRPWLQLAGGVDLRANSHDQIEDVWRLDFSDRIAPRPRMSIRRLSATVAHGRFTADVGKQFIRRGRTDILNPTDRFAPRDFLNVVDTEFLGVTGARGVVQASDTDTVEVVWLPRFTPSRIPLLDQRWTAVPTAAQGIQIVDAGATLPDGSQTGVRWNHVGAGFEYSFSFFDGFNHLPNIEVGLVGQVGQVGQGPPQGIGQIAVTRLYPAIRTYGADAAVPTRWFTIKGESAYFTSSSPMTDEYVLYVLQLERQTGEWVFVGGYADEVVTNRRSALNFAPDRGTTKSIIGRGAYTIDPNRSLAVEAAVRQNGVGAYLKAEYSQARGQHWRATAAVALIGGEPDDFLGQYRRNSHVSLALRYSY